MRPAQLLFAITICGLVSAHSQPSAPTQAEVEVQRNLQAAAYYCAPSVAKFTAERQRRYAEKLGYVTGDTGPKSIAGLAGYEDLFSAGSYEDLAGQKPLASDGKKEENELMSCAPVRETRIQNNTCVLTPVVTEGPYYHKAGHPVRQSMGEYQNGLLLHLDIGVIDVNTCKPLPNVLVDIWHANATGFYAGHPVPRPHLVNEKPQVGGKRSGLLSAYPRTIDEEQWLRAAWPTDEHGVAQFTTIFPGYYTGRATHIHTKVFTEWEILPNGSFVSPSLKEAEAEVNGRRLSGRAGKSGLAHVGQFFFEDAVNIEIDKMHPYNENPIRDTHGRTRNWRDSLNIFEDSHGPEGKYDPVFKTHLLGGVISQGLGAWITMGINASADNLDNWWKG